MKIGSLSDAKLIHRRRKSGKGPLPKGWKLLGAGTYRKAYLSPDGTVYKVDVGGFDNSTNYHEFLNYSNINKRKLPKGWSIAPTKLYSFDDVNIIAMKYIEGYHEDIDDWPVDEIYKHFSDNRASAAFKVCNIMDLHEGNYVVTPRGTKVIIDLGA